VTLAPYPPVALGVRLEERMRRRSTGSPVVPVPAVASSLAPAVLPGPAELPGLAELLGPAALLEPD